MPRFIDNFLNRITMYKIVLYVLVALEIVALILSTLGLLSFSPLSLIYSSVIIILASWVTNKLFAYVFKTHANAESYVITALILALIISPPQITEYLSIIPFLIWASVWAMASKFILAINKKHVFNPAAFAVALTALTIDQSATWWVGSIYMLPFVFVGGLLITRKIHRFDLVISFSVFALISNLVTSNLSGGLSSVLDELQKIFVYTPIAFFAFVMLTEPLTTPPTRFHRLTYGAVTGLLFAPALHIGSLYFTPELALLAGNVVAFTLSPMRKYLLTLKESNIIAPNTGEFVFTPDHPLIFKAGQYLEWTLGAIGAEGSVKKMDSRGNRRYFTIASSPTESEVRLGVKFFPKSSTFKESLALMKPGDTIMAGHISGDFTLPRNKSNKLVFIAGGIGITPFRSMMKYMIDSGDERDVTLIYSNNSPEEIAYRDIWDEAVAKIGARIVYTLTDESKIPQNWTGEKGQVNSAMIMRNIPDHRQRVFYISGPHGMVGACDAMLRQLEINSRNIMTDYFPGFA